MSFSALKQSKLFLPIYFAFTFILLIESFANNTFKITSQNFFLKFQKNMESYVVGRMVKTRSNGFFSDSMFTGLGYRKNMNRTQTKDFIQEQYSAFLNNDSFASYYPYLSHPGGQAFAYSFLDQSLDISSRIKIYLFRLVSSVLAALIFVAIILWFLFEFNLLASIFAFISILFSMWITFYSKNLWWSIWAFYLPMAVTMFYIRMRPLDVIQMHYRICIIVLFCIVLKWFFTGFEFITTSIIMMLIPILYYTIKAKIKDQIDNKNIAALCLKIFVICVISICFCLYLLSMQIDSYKHEKNAGIKHIIFSLTKRTYSDSKNFDKAYESGLKAGLMDTMWVYIKGEYLDLNHWVDTNNQVVRKVILKVRYIYLIIMILIASIISYQYLWKKCNFQDINHKALLITTWLSISGPLSWIIIFKSHSAVHYHMNFIIWQMPFTIFGFALCGNTVYHSFKFMYKVDR